MADKFCLDLTMDDLKTWCDAQHVPSFRAKQIYKWLSSGVIDTSEMTNIPKDLRAKLEEDFIFGGMTVINEWAAPSVLLPSSDSEDPLPPARCSLRFFCLRNTSESVSTAW